MQVEWDHHSSELVERLTSFLREGALQDVTLCSSEGKKIKAHRVILAATSTYFKEVLVSGDVDDPGKLPIIFLKDVPYSELECLIQYIYTGKVVLPESLSLANFTQLAKILGISGFTDGSSGVIEEGVVKRYSEKSAQVDEQTKGTFKTLKDNYESQFKYENDVKSLSATSSISSTATTLFKRNGSNDINSFISGRIPFSDILNKRYQENTARNENARFMKNPNNLSLVVSSSSNNVSNELYMNSQHTSSEPAIMPSQEYDPDTNEEGIYNTEISSPTDQKRRRLQCHSLDDIDPRICTPPSPFKTPRGMKSRHKSPKSRLATAWPMSPGAQKSPLTPLSPLVLNSLWSNAPVLANNDSMSMSPRSLSFHHPISSEKDDNRGVENSLANISLPIRATTLNASRQMSCPVNSKSPKVDVPIPSNFSLDSSSLSLLDPNDLAAKGATLLHHLAVWMIEENKCKEASSANTSLAAPNVQNLPPTKADNENQGPVYENLMDLQNKTGDNLSFRAEITIDKDAPTSSISDFNNKRSAKGNDETQTITSTTAFKMPLLLNTRSRQLSAPGGVMSSSTRLPSNLVNMSFGGGIGSRLTLRQGSECTDRPDSGFDSKDEEEVRSSSSGGDRSVLVGSFSSSSHNTTQEGQDLPPLIRPSSRGPPYQEQQHVSEPISEEALSGVNSGANEDNTEKPEVASEESSSSPEVSAQISRQASTRQPVIRKRRFNP